MQISLKSVLPERGFKIAKKGKQGDELELIVGG